MALRKKVVLLLCLGVVVIVVQMFAISILSSQPPSQLPSWADAVLKEKRGEGTPLQHVSWLA